MLEAAKRLEFERAASLRDRVDELRSTLRRASRRSASGRPRAPAARARREPRRRSHRFGKDR